MAIEQERFAGMAGQPYQKMNFNSRGQMTNVGLSADGVNWNGGGSIVNNFGTTNNNGNVQGQQIIVADGSTFNQTYGYDQLNRLKSVTEKRNGSGSDTFNQTFITTAGVTGRLTRRRLSMLQNQNKRIAQLHD